MRLLAIWFVSATLLTACGSIFASKDEGTYTATLTGAVEDTFEGEATAGPGGVMSPYEYLTHGKLPDDSVGTAGLYLYSSERPDAGTYRIVEFYTGNPPAGRIEAAFRLDNRTSYRSTSGELRVTSEDPFEGTFRFSADGSDGPIEVSGSFSIP